MDILRKPNVWIDSDATGNTLLTYALRTTPAPLTVSIPDQTTEYATLQFVITNPTGNDVTVNSIDFTLLVGTSSTSITPTTVGILTQVSDTTNWHITPSTGPTSVVYSLGPKAGTTVTLAKGASLWFDIYQLQTGEHPGSSTVTVKETLQGASPTFTKFSVTTFPDGFYFNGLIATVPQGSALVPVAQIENNGTSNVTLVWNSSVTELTAFSVLYSSATGGQQSDTPTEVGLWASPPLTSDTAFTVTVSITMEGGAPLTAAMSTVVSVQNPNLVAANITAGAETVTGALTVRGATTAAAVNAASATITGNTSVAGAITAASASVAGAITAATASVTGATLCNGSLSVKGSVSMLKGGTKIASGTSIAYTTIQAPTDGFAVAYVTTLTDVPALPPVTAYGSALIYSSGMWFAINGGLLSSAPNPNVMTIPVSKGSTWYYMAANAGNTPAKVEIQIWWFPIGGTSPSPALGFVEEGEIEIAPPPPPPPDIGMITEQRSAVATDFLAKLEAAFGTTLAGDAKTELRDLLLKL